MVAVLKVWSNFSGKQLGTIEIGRNDPSETSDGRWFEWQGLNGTSDGGTWHWTDHPVYGGSFVMILVSNSNKERVGRVENGDWGKDEPREPLFKPGSSGPFFHFPFGGTVMEALWGKV